MLFVLTATPSQLLWVVVFTEGLTREGYTDRWRSFRFQPCAYSLSLIPNSNVKLVDVIASTDLLPSFFGKDADNGIPDKKVLYTIK